MLTNLIVVIYLAIYVYEIIMLYTLNLHILILYINKISIKLEKRKYKKIYLDLICQYFIENIYKWDLEYSFTHNRNMLIIDASSLNAKTSFLDYCFKHFECNFFTMNWIYFSFINRVY